MKKKSAELPKDGPYKRLSDTAVRLIYEQGYSGTSVNQVIEESESHKASFYRYFQTKDDLGKEYLERQGKDFQNGWERLMEKSESPQEFIRRWMALLKKQVKMGRYFGCPLARFMGSLDQPDEDWADRSSNVLESWIFCLETYFDRNKSEHILPEDFPSRKKAELIMKLFQGNSQLYMMTRNPKYFDDMQEEMLSTIANI
ncbi:TetR/AcrR family transcriptional regulator [Leptospira wolffii]|uniref:TetR family transcriptional regulator n=1 Tax=Leptospira wolffii TaxID=409998 RepID=A0A2M9ZGM8_9LEPT|nr:TetR/AcrR family transcriptional regulator [Leptospira wolffii]PJZ67592.1 TetR family transcriptional regulator [Leptospira wolffii]TGK62602.1 TetR/AcrR family transcriptional regulator [Leptospira wolffii]TGK65577.1 TetR/AcrR family transcriptional regulator [Leptospira wolffii]TGK74012.1 TetR/AcrR family transcriptional regulator [Leptospira wolffii]TGL28872.1 TetR/AcrR family transcriptional regulator [Leptospira wolffii]